MSGIGFVPVPRSCFVDRHAQLPDESLKVALAPGTNMKELESSLIQDTHDSTGADVGG
jgi:hypothetical protein